MAKAKDTSSKEGVKEPKIYDAIIVTDGSKLNMRVKPDVAADRICQLNNGEKVKAILAGSKNGFVKVYTSAGIEGYCMKKFLEIKK